MKSRDEIRATVTELLSLLSSKEKQIDYQKASPSVNVALELLCRWFDELYNPGFQLFQRSFSANELKSIHEFNQYYSLRKSKLPETIEQLHLDSDWGVIMQEATRLLDELD